MTEERQKTRSSRYQEEIKVEDVEESPIQNESQNTSSKKQIEETKKEKKSHPLLNKIILSIIILFIAIAAYSTLIEPKLLIVKEYKIESKEIPESFHGLKIVHFSDIHYGTTINKKQLSKIVDKINELKPDIVVFTGNLLDANIDLTETAKEDVITTLNKINCSLYKYAIYGNEDLDNKDFKNIMTKTNFIILDNKSVPLYYKGTTPILITGYNPIISSPNYEITNEDTEVNSYYEITLTHEPDALDNFISQNPNLVLSGHSLGGIVDLKFTKPLFLQEHSKKYFEDYQKVKNTELYISNGVGTNSFNMRLLNPPSINLYRLYKTK
jgi:predicted MPP superfamily phosphohydrolase